MMLRKNIAVVGCGYWGKNLVRNFHELGSLSCVCDPNTELANELSNKFNIKVASFEEILNNQMIEGVVLAVPAPLHAKMAIQVMNSGKHVYVEKPLALNKKEAESMILASEENRVNLMVGHLLQYHPVFVKLKDLVKEGALGDIEYIHSSRMSFGKVRSEEDVIWSFAPHDISMILSLIDRNVSSVFAESKSILQNNISDIATIFIEFENHVKAQVSVSWLNPEKKQQLVVTGTNAIAVFDDTKEWNEKLSLYRYKRNQDKYNNLILQQEEIELVKVNKSEPLKEECEHFCKLIDGKVDNLTDGKEGMNVLNILNKSSQSIRMKKN